MEEEILAILQTVNAEIDYKEERRIFSDKLLDSIQMVDLIVALSEEFGIEIDYKSITPENFDSIDKMEALIDRAKRV